MNWICSEESLGTLILVISARSSNIIWFLHLSHCLDLAAPGDLNHQENSALVHHHQKPTKSNSTTFSYQITIVHQKLQTTAFTALLLSVLKAVAKKFLFQIKQMMLIEHGLAKLDEKISSKYHFLLIQEQQHVRASSLAVNSLLNPFMK